MTPTDPGTDEPRPNLLVIGAARSGTTALCDALARHRDIFITTPKDVHFLASATKTHHRAVGQADDDMAATRRPVTDPVRYRRLFRPGVGCRFRGEGSVSTLYDPSRSIPAIEANAAADVRLIAILRNPVHRAHSAYLHLRDRGVEHSSTFEQSLALEERRIAGGYPHDWHLRAMGRYRDQLPPFVDAFGDRLLVLIHEEFRRLPEATLDRVHRFLGLDPLVPLIPNPPDNPTSTVRTDLFGSVMNGIRRAPMAQQLARTAAPWALRERARPAPAERPTLDPVTEARLIADYRPDVAAVEQVLGRTIDDWRRR